MAYIKHWRKPTGNSGTWDNPANAYDDNLATYAATSGTSFHTFNAPADMGRTKSIRFYAADYNGVVESDPNLQIDVYHNGAWETVYNGSATKNTWIEASITGAAKVIEYLRVKRNSGISLLLKEVEFETMWTSPIANLDSGGNWEDEINAYDMNFSTYSEAQNQGEGDSYALELQGAASGYGDCSRVRMKITKYGGGSCNVKLAIKADGGSYVTIFDGIISSSDFVEYSFTPVATGDLWLRITPNDEDESLRAMEAEFCGEYYPAQVTITISSGTGGDVTTPGEGAYPYNVGQVVNIVATSDPTYNFTNWTGTAVDAGKVANPNQADTTMTCEDNYTLVANFTLALFTLTTSSGSGGDVTTPGEGNYYYAPEAHADIVATADAGNHFVSWTGTAVTLGLVDNPNSSTTFVVMLEPCAVQANFAIDTAKDDFLIYEFCPSWLGAL